jgi:glutamyl-tRNA synthetase
MDGFRKSFAELVKAGHIYESTHSRRQIREAEPVPSPANGDPIFPSTLRQPVQTTIGSPQPDTIYRFRVPDGRELRFEDGRLGQQCFVAGRDFGDFIIWKKDGYPAYELAVVVDDHAMDISEVVRGEDLLLATSRQLLLYEALGWTPPAWYHCPLVKDPRTNHRMSKTLQSLALRTLREAGHSPGLPPETYFSHSKD